MDEIDRMLANSETVIANIEQPQAHFQRHSKRYLDIIKTITKQTLNILRPPDADDASWRRYSIHFVNAITSLAFSHGLSINYGGRTDPSLDDSDAEGSPDHITMADILDWIEAGEAGDAQGKDITKADIDPKTGEVDREAIAAKLYNGLSDGYSGSVDFSGIRNRLEEWITVGTDVTFDDVLPAILQAWETGLTPIVQSDYSDYVDEQLKSL